MRTHKVFPFLIDFQRCFMDLPGMPLPVSGALGDAARMADFIRVNKTEFSGVLMSMDRHKTNHIAHPAPWKNEVGESPTPFATVIHPEDMERKAWLPRNPVLYNCYFNYLTSLEKRGGIHRIWPVHASESGTDQAVESTLRTALGEWEAETGLNMSVITKGLNLYTEHFGALIAEVPNIADPTTILNESALEQLRLADIIPVGGEALDFCVITTLRQLSRYLGKQHLSKVWVLTDCTSPVVVPSGMSVAEASKTFFDEIEAMGMRLTTSTELTF